MRNPLLVIGLSLGAVMAADQLPGGHISSWLAERWRGVTPAQQPGPLRNPTPAQVAAWPRTREGMAVAPRMGAAFGAFAPIVNLDSVNPGETRDYAACLTVQLADNGASRCGDMLLYQPLPATTVRAQEYAPALVYNSATAQPFPLVNVLSQRPPGSPSIDSMRVELSMVGVNTTQRFLGLTSWPAGQVRQTAIGFSAPANFATGAYDYNVRVVFAYSNATKDSTVASGVYLLVNFKDSPHGAGWGVAGWERIYNQAPDLITGRPRMLRIEGDGSAKLYFNPVNQPANTFVGYRNLDFPDTLIYQRADGRGERKLRGGARLVYSNSGCLDSVIDVRQARTSYGYVACGINTVHSNIILPSGLQYTWTHTGGVVSQITAPPNGAQSRFVQPTVAGGQMLSFRDADNRVLTFGYGLPGFPNFLARKIDKLGNWSDYIYDQARKVLYGWRYLDACPSPCSSKIEWTVSSAQSLAWNSVVDTAALWAVVNGPRTGNIDITQFKVNRFGAPKLIRNALSQDTRLDRTDPRFLDLVTRMTDPSGYLRGVGYDARGNIAADTAFGPLAPQSFANPVTTYTFDQVCDRPTLVATPQGATSTAAYDATPLARCNQLWVQVGPDTMRRTYFFYYASAAAVNNNLVRAVHHPRTQGVNQREVDSLEYDASRGNLLRSGQWVYISGTTTELTRTVFTTDPIGRVQETCRLIVPGGSNSQCSIRRYDIMDRDSIVTDSGPQLPTTTSWKVARAESFHDAEGNLIRLERRSLTNGVLDTAGVIRTLWQYDRADRRVAEIAPDGRKDSTVLDPAGNAVQWRSRRTVLGGSTPLTVDMTYDPLNRVATRSLRAVEYLPRLQGIPTLPFPTSDTAAYANVAYPWFSNRSGGGYRINGSIEQFDYDNRGLLIRADNEDARVRRTYYPNGRIRSETLHVRNIRQATFGHTYVTGYEYDLDFNRTRVIGDPILANSSAGVNNLTSYNYDYATNQLANIGDPLGGFYVFETNFQGQLSRVNFPGQIERRLRYDGAGRLHTDSIINLDTVSANRFPSSRLRAATLQYDARGLRTSLANTVWNLDTLTSTYNGIGHLFASFAAVRTPTSTAAVPSVRSQSRDTLVNDAMGNQLNARRYWQSNVAASQGSSQPFEVRVGGNVQQVQPGTGRLMRAQRYPTFAGQFLLDSTVYDGSGNVEFQYTPSFTVTTAALLNFKDRASYYDALDRLRATDSRTAEPEGQEFKMTWNFEEYRLDALGRRVVLRTRRTCSTSYGTTQPPVNFGYPPCAVSLVRRTVWDGAMPLFEVQQPGYESSSDPELENDVGFPARRALFDPNGVRVDPNEYFGRVMYVNGAGIDQPLGVMRWGFQTDSLGGTQYPLPFMLVPHWNADGQPVNGAFSSGSTLHCPAGKPCIYVGWPFGWTPFQQKTWQQLAWYGSLLEESRDGSGLMYKRNRYLDPFTARFTQEDPIGLAGGLNLYGYAGGDPVNFSDPFGLCPKDQGGDGKTKVLSDCPQGTKGWNTYSSGAAEAVDDPFILFFGGLELRGAKATVAAMAEASETLLAQAMGSGFRKSIAGAGSKTVFRDAQRLAATYGGRASDWAKMTGRSVKVDGKLIQLHWYENVITGVKTEFKQKIPWLVP